MNLANIVAKVTAINIDAAVDAAVKREGLPADRAQNAAETYRQFLALVAAYPEKAICVPSDADKVWHQHILATAQYAKDCTALCGRSIHHDPTAFGTPEFSAAWSETVKLYKAHFGVDLDTDPTALDRTPLSAATCYVMPTIAPDGRHIEVQEHYRPAGHPGWASPRRYRLSPPPTPPRTCTTMFAAAALWAIISSLLFVAANAMVKAIGPALPSAEVSLFRAAGSLLLIVLAWRELRTLRRIADPKWHLIRGTLGAVTMVCLMYAFATLPMALATSVYYARVLIMIPLAGLLLGERAGWDLWTAAILGFVGVGIATGPILDTAAVAAGTIPLLIATVTSAGSQVAATRLTRSNPPSVIVSVFAVVALAILTVPATATWTPPASGEVAMLIGLGLAGGLAQYAVTRAYALAGAGRIAPISYIEIPLAAVIGWTMAREIPTAHQVVGASLVVASTIYVSLARRPAQVQEAADPPACVSRSLHPVGSGDADHG